MSFGIPANAQVVVLNASLPFIAAIDPDTLMMASWEAQSNFFGANTDVDAAIAETPAAAVVDASPAPKLNPTGRDITLSAPMRDGDFVLSEVGFVLGADDSVRVDTKSFVEALRPNLAADKLELLQTKLAGMEYAPVDQLAQLGYIVRYDAATIALTVQIPAEVRTARDLSLQRFEDPATGVVYQPATLSGFINFRSFADYIWGGSNSGLQSPTMLVDSAIRYKGFVLENEATVRFGGDGERVFTREVSRLVYDDRRRLMRFSAGDLNTSGRGFSSSPQLAGLSAQRVFSIVDPLRMVQPTGDRSFTITRPSTVEATINGLSVRRIRLEPGVYNVRDFPFVQGTNNVQFNIEDDAGGRQTIAFSQFFDRTLLAEGLTEFAVQAGVVAQQGQGSRDYQFGRPAASGWFRRVRVERTAR